jgi:hypothetical protein
MDQPKKVCKRCGEEKVLSEFYICKKNIRGVCKTCSKRTQKLYRQKNKEKANIYAREYRQKNKEKVNIREREYWQKNKEKVNISRREKYQENCKQEKYKIRNRSQYLKRKHKPSFIQKRREFDKRESINLSDRYIATQLHTSLVELRKYPELIEAKRIQLQINRELKMFNQNKEK